MVGPSNLGDDSLPEPKRRRAGLKPSPVYEIDNGPVTWTDGFDQWRHRARGTTYQRLGGAEVQSGRPIKEGDVLTVYLDADGKLWVRPVEEFHDGRFEKL